VRQKGFAPIIIILLIVVLGAVGYFGYTKGYLGSSGLKLLSSPTPTSGSTTKTNCSGLTETQCRNQANCVPLGNAITTVLAGGEKETFSFSECVEKVSQYSSCNEVVKMTQMRGGSKYSKECRCCCGENPFCNPKKPYPEK
jgi:hypothetical protein